MTLPDLSEEVKEAQSKLTWMSGDLGAAELETLHEIASKQFACETQTRRKVSLKTIEMNIVKAKHAVVEEEEDFV